MVKGEGLLYPSEKLVPKRKDYRGTMWLAPEFPRQIAEFLPILQVRIRAHKHEQTQHELTRHKCCFAHPLHFQGEASC